MKARKFHKTKENQKSFFLNKNSNYEQVENITTNELLEKLDQGGSYVEEMKGKIEKKTLFTFHCELFLTESFYRLCNILRNIKEKKASPYELLSKSFILYLDENIKYIEEKREGLIRLRASQKEMKYEKPEGFEYKRRSLLFPIKKLEKIHSFMPLNQKEIKSLILKHFPQEDSIAEEISIVIKDDEMLSYYLKEEQMEEILIEIQASEKQNSLLDILNKLRNKAYECFFLEFSGLFNHYQTMILEIRKKSEALVLKIFYYKPEFQMENIRIDSTYSYFDSEMFKKAVNNRLQLYMQFYGLKKMKKVGQKTIFSLDTVIQNIENEEQEKEKEEEDNYREKIRIKIKNFSRQNPSKNSYSLINFEEPSPTKEIKVSKIETKKGKELKNKRNRALSFVIQGYKDLLLKKGELRKYEKEEILKKKHTLSFENSVFSSISMDRTYN